MRHFLSRTLIFLFPVFVFGALIEFSLRGIPNEYKYKAGYLKKNAKEIEVLFLGNSHIYYGINPSYISKKSFNAAHTAQSLKYDLAILEKYSDNLNALKYIVVPADYLTLFSQLETGQESWRVKNYQIYYDLGNANSISDNFEVLNHKLELHFKRLINYYINKKNTVTINNLGWGTGYKSVNSRDLAATGRSAVTRHTAKDYRQLAYNKKNLELILNIAAKKNAKVILLTSPLYKTYVEKQNKDQVAKTYSLMDSITKNNQHVFWLNASLDSSFVKQDFYDADHLNEIGSRKLSLKVAEFIASKEAEAS